MTTESEPDSLDYRIRELDMNSEPSVDYAHHENDIVEGELQPGLEYDSDYEEWYRQELHEQWENVVERLINKEIVWDELEEGNDEGWNPSVCVLDPRKKESLAGVNIRDRAYPTVLHRLAVNFNSENFQSLPQDTRLHIIQYFLQHRRENPRSHLAKIEDPILTRAFEKDNVQFLNFIIDNCTGSLQDLLDATDSVGENCLHHILKTHLPQAIDTENANKASRHSRPMIIDVQSTMKLLGSLVNVASPHCLAARDSDGNTPIHYALEYKICRVGHPQYNQIVWDLIKTGDKFLASSQGKASQFNNIGESPYRYLERTQREWLLVLDKQSQATTRAATAAPVTKYGGKTTKPKQSDTRNDGGQRSKADQLEKGKESTAQKAPKGPAAKASRDIGPSKNPVTPQVKRGISTPSMQDIKGESLMTAPEVYASARSSTTATPGTRPVKTGRETKRSDTLSPAAKILRYPQPSDSAMAKDKSIAPEPNHGKLIAPEPPRNPGEDYEKSKRAAEEVRRMLKLHYIRTRPDREAKELLYGDAALDKNFYLDATHLEAQGPAEFTTLIEMLAKPGGLEDTLSYVKLPVMSYVSENATGSNIDEKAYGANQSRQRESKGQEERITGRNSVVAVFDKLAQVGVHNILQLTVEDMISPPHTDAAIERAISGQDFVVSKEKRQEGRKEGRIAIETWNWRKFDLSTEVIRVSTPEVFEINLYWSGNQTILKGWACNEGIPRLYVSSNKKLRIVTVHWTPGFENIDKCEALLEDFQKSIENSTKSETRLGVVVQVKRLMTSKATGAIEDSRPFAAGTIRGPPDHGWIDSMKTFRMAMMKVHENVGSNFKARRVKVALIDDGVDRARLHTYNDRVEITGMSYLAPVAGGAGQNPSWHQSSHGHGSIMANSIVRVNPWVFLYAMRIQDEVDVGPRNNRSIRIHAERAAEAIEDAIIAGVEIISISWTIRNHANEATDALKKAIDKAKRANILIFCSASDDMQKVPIDTLPYSQVREYAFRIGAADAYGWSDKVTEDHGTIDWFFPGNQVADDFNPRFARDNELIYRDGSSVATALAAGFASLIMYLVNLLKAHYTIEKRSADADRFSRYAVLLHQRDGMKKAFENIITDNNYKDKKFLPVWDSFGTRAEKILAKAKDRGTDWDTLDELCTKLVA